MKSSVAIATAQAICARDVSFTGVGGYKSAIETLNSLKGVRGFLWREYSPASAARGFERRYFTQRNAARIDAVRLRIERWRTSGVITALESQLLIADLLLAANRIANIAGTYGCFLRHWTANARQALLLTPRSLRRRRSQVEATCQDVFSVISTPQDTVYLDPPYTKRHYAAYYHVLETIAEGDAPDVSGVTGLRPWEDKASPFCYKTRALGALHGRDAVRRLEEGLDASDDCVRAAYLRERCGDSRTSARQANGRQRQN